jgi:predicted amidophosphoribosyltransferase
MAHLSFMLGGFPADAATILVMIPALHCAYLPNVPFHKSRERRRKFNPAAKKLPPQR